MQILSGILLSAAGLSLGFFIASGLVALVIGLGIVTRYAGISKTAKSLRFYECCCMAGALFGNLISISTFSLSLPTWTLGVFWLFAGVYLGSWIIALGEVVSLFSILCRRIGLTRGLPFVIFCMAAGKIAGSLFYFAAGLARV
ncbi:stage V sporulation protein AB [Fusicatenibacter sp.]